MKIKKTYIWITILIVVIAAGLYAYYEYNRKPADLSDVEAQTSITADSLVLSFETNEQNANSLYLGKPVNITGVIAEINNQQDTIVNVTLGKKDNMHKVSCLMDVNHSKEIKNFKVGDKITLRGICNGYLMDVELNRCVVINEQN
jgi:uncharacterized protein YpmB